MNFKDWYSKAVRGDDGNDFEGIPIILIKNNEHYKQVIFELERLGFGSGNDFSKHGDISEVKIWYSDFWNSFIIPSEIRVADITFTLEDLIEIERREDF